MIVLHGTWKPADSIVKHRTILPVGKDSSRPLKRRGRPPKIASDEALTNNFQAADKDILHIIRSLDLKNTTFVSENTHSADATFLLLLFSKYPQPSPDMLREDESENIEELVELAYWKINDLYIPPQDAVLLFNSFTGAWMEKDGYTLEQTCVFFD